MVERPLAHLYQELLLLAESDPLEAVGRWLQSVPMEQGVAAVIVDSHEKMLKRLLREARETAGSDQSELLESLQAQAQERVAGLRRHAYAPADIGFSLTGQNVRRKQAGSLPVTADCPPDIRCLADNSLAWTEMDWRKWLVSGLHAVLQEQPNRHLAFRPIRLYPGERLIEQLATVLIEGAEFGLHVREEVLQAISGLLASKSQYPYALDTLLWHLFEDLQPPGSTRTVAQHYLVRLKRDKGMEASEGLLRRICSFVWNLGIDESARAWFFEWFAELFPLPSMKASLILALLNEAIAEPDLAEQTVPSAAAQAQNIYLQDPGAVSLELGSLLDLQLLNPDVAALARTGIRHVQDLIACLPSLIGDWQNWPPRVPEPIPLEEAGILAFAD